MVLCDVELVTRVRREGQDQLVYHRTPHHTGVNLRHINMWQSACIHAHAKKKVTICRKNKTAAPKKNTKTRTFSISTHHPTRGATAPRCLMAVDSSELFCQAKFSEPDYSQNSPPRTQRRRPTKRKQMGDTQSRYTSQEYQNNTGRCMNTRYNTSFFTACLYLQKKTEQIIHGNTRLYSLLHQLDENDNKKRVCCFRPN